MSVAGWCGWCGKQRCPTSPLFLTLLPTASTLALLLCQFSLTLFAPLPPTLLLMCTHTPFPPTNQLCFPREGSVWLVAGSPQRWPGDLQAQRQHRAKWVCYAGQQSRAQVSDVNTALRTIAPNKSLLKSRYHAGVLFDMLHASAVLSLWLVYTRLVRVVCSNFTESVLYLSRYFFAFFLKLRNSGS